MNLIRTGDEALNQEKPPPTRPAISAVESREYSRRNETGERTRKQVAGVENREPGSSLFTLVEQTDHIQCARIEGSLHDAEHKSADCK